MEPIAVVGMGAIFPDSMNLCEYWSNILASRNSLRELPDQYWLKEDYYDPDKSAPDKSYSKTAGVVGNIGFDALEFGITPVDLESISVDQIFALVVAKQALQDAGLYGENAKDFDHRRAGVIVASSIGKNAFSLYSRLQMPKYKRILMNSGVSEKLADLIIKKMSDTELEWTDQSNPGYLANVVAGRIASRFDLYGVNFSVDAACASSLAAVKCAVSELRSGNCDIMLTGGVNLDCSEFSFVSFCKTPAISPSGNIRPFDKKSDGMLLGDGVGMMVLKRLSTAEKDGDRIYGVIKGVGAGGDGKSKGIFSPNVEGQIRTLENAYENAGVNVADVTLFEAHGTGTRVGDNYEIEALDRFIKKNGVSHKVGIGSVKSQIGHTRLAAGAASMIKVLLALHHKVMPATINVDEPTELLNGSMINVLQESRPWITSKENPVRCVGVSAFGFGGTNYHVVLEEYGKDSEKRGKYRINSIPASVVINAESKEALRQKINDMRDELLSDSKASVEQLYGKTDLPSDELCVGFVAYDKSDAIAKLEAVSEIIDDLDFNNKLRKINDYYYIKSGKRNKKIAVLIDEGIKAKVGNLKDISMNFPELRNSLKKVDDACAHRGESKASELLYPFGNCSDGAELSDTVSSALLNGVYKILKNRGLKADTVICRNKYLKNAKYICGIEKEAFCYKESKKKNDPDKNEYCLYHKQKQILKGGKIEKCIDKALDEKVNTVLVIGSGSAVSDKAEKANIIRLFDSEPKNDLYALEDAVLQLRMSGAALDKDLYSDVSRFDRKSVKKHVIDINPRIYRSERKERIIEEILKPSFNDDAKIEKKTALSEETTAVKEVPSVAVKTAAEAVENNNRDTVKITKAAAPERKKAIKAAPAKKPVPVKKAVDLKKLRSQTEINSIGVKNYLKQQSNAFNMLVDYVSSGDMHPELPDMIKEMKEILNSSADAFISLMNKQKKNDNTVSQIVPLHNSDMRRLQVELKVAEYEKSDLKIKKGAVLVLVESAKVGEDVCRKLKENGFEPYRILLGDDDSICSVRPCDIERIESIYQEISRKKSMDITGFMFISDAGKNNDLRASIDIVKTVYFFAKFFRTMPCNELAAGQRRFFFNVVRMDGKLGFDGKGQQTALGGLMGLSKSLFYEWYEDTIVKGIDVHPEISGSEMSDLLMGELNAAQKNYPELGIDPDGTKRYISLKEHDTVFYGSCEPKKDDVILVTGGGKGITAKCILSMAKKYKCRFVLLGRTELSDNVDAYAEADTKREIQDMLISKMRVEKKMMKPAELSVMVNRIYSQTTIRRTLRELEASGASALYYSCDINNDEQVGRIISDAESKFGKITGFIHGAGVLADKLISDMTERDFDIVVKTKIFGLDSCLKNIDLSNLKYLIMFSSVAAFFGNKGQSNYALANEIMNKMAFMIKRKHPKCVVSAINWGPWDHGMINDSLKEAFKARNISILPVDRGVEIFMEQFLYDQQYSQSQIVVFDKMYF